MQILTAEKGTEGDLRVSVVSGTAVLRFAEAVTPRARYSLRQS
jgi:hypothetical protein